MQTRSQFLTQQGDLVIHCQEHRTQKDNIEECFNKLYTFITKNSNLPGNTSAEQKEKVAKLKKEEKNLRMQAKLHISRKKDARRNRDFD